MELSTSVDKALDLVFHLHEKAMPQGISQVARDLGLPKASVHRLLQTLTRRGLTEQGDDGRYRPGGALIALGLGVLEREPVVELARPVLQAEAEALGETVFLTALRAAQMVVLDKAEGSGFLRAAPQVGASVPLHATAVGKLALAFGAVPDLALQDLAAFTAETRTEESALAVELALTRTRGHATNQDEWVDGLSVVAAPVRAPRDGRFIAALAIAAPTPRMLALGFDAVASVAVRAAAEIEARLAGQIEPATRATASRRAS